MEMNVKILLLKLKEKLTNALLLAYSMPNEIFIIDCDVSQDATEPVLSQLQNGEESVIAYFSKCFSKPKRRYCVTRREVLAVVNAVKYFHHYLFGNHFLVRSDHGALRWLTNFKGPEGQIARWLEFLSTYDFEIKYRAGRVHSNADALSRRPCISEDCAYCDRAEVKYVNVIQTYTVSTGGMFDNAKDCLSQKKCRSRKF
jgi:hypothetical protein